MGKVLGGTSGAGEGHIATTDLLRVETTNPKLVAAITPIIADLDEIFSEQRRKLLQRPMDVTLFLIKHHVKVTNGGNVNDPWDEEWFAIIFAIVHKWYQRKYGEAFVSRANIAGMVTIHKMPYLVRVPQTYFEKGENPAIHFCEEVGDKERPRMWIQLAPNLSCLDQNDQRALDHDLRDLTRNLRTINRRFMMADSTGVNSRPYRAISFAA